MRNFRIGDAVRLVSGSPAMTVNGPAHRLGHDKSTLHCRKVDCVWFVDGAMHTGTFDADALTIDEKGSKQ